MSKFRAYCELSLADFRERTRRSGFIVTMLGIVFFGYLVITGKYTVQFGEYRAVYDAVWAGTLMAVCGSIMLALFGFYLVRGSIKRDRTTEVGQIIAATPMSKTAYLFSKLLSNTVVLMFMLAVLAAMSLVTLLFRNEAESIDLIAFLLPFTLISIPAIFFVASMAVLFDTVRWLRGSIGNVIYLFAAEFCIVFGMLKVPLLDLAAATAFTESARAAAAQTFAGERIPLLMGFVMFDPSMQVEVFKTFDWKGIEWTSAAVSLRLFWMGAAAAIFGMAVPWFDRFDSSHLRKITPSSKAKQPTKTAKVTASPGVSTPAYRELEIPRLRFSVVRMAIVELRLAVKGYHWFWYAVAVGLIAAQLAAPFEIARQYLVPVAMAWPLVIWSAMGTRESRFGTDLLLYSSPEPVRRQLPAIWLSGFAVALMAVGGMMIRAFVAGEAWYVVGLLAASVLIPSVALGFGSFTGSRRLFEVVYLMIWYIGSIEHLTAVDVLGTHPESIFPEKLVFLGLLSLAMMCGTAAARRVRMLRP